MEKRVLFADFYVCADVPKQLSNNFLYVAVAADLKLN
jgi:hypothetical protein